MYPIACWGNKDVGTQSNALHRNLLVMERTYYRYMYLQHGVGRNHTPARMYYTCAVTQIGVVNR
jgi:hypothetical protein